MSSWLPWQFLLRVAARRRGFIDPIDLLARLRRFAQPSEVQEPIELVRAGVLFHARGLINTKVFQYNLDWVWPYWVVRQFDPGDPSFLPRAFSFSHVNLTHRNWTALGLPGTDDYPIVDPRGLVTLPADPWSLDWWFLPESGEPLFPSQTPEAAQHLDLSRGLEVITRCERPGLVLESTATMEAGTASASACVVLRASLRSDTAGVLLLAARPANPEGVHFIEHIRFEERGWVTNGRHRVRLTPAPAGFLGSTYREGDLPGNLHAWRIADDQVHCAAGMATAAATYEVRPGEMLQVAATVELNPAKATFGSVRSVRAPAATWEAALAGVPEIEIPDGHWRFLHAAALRTLILLSPGEIFPGPSTYRRFWFRDACLVMHALLAANRDERVRAALDHFPRRQRADGYFHSQEGEWDANGQVLWIADRYERMTRQLLPASFVHSLRRGAQWIGRKRRPRGGGPPGLLPPGFSAEHLGPVDRYYWDDFWGIAGLRAATRFMARHGDGTTSQVFQREGVAFARDLRQSLNDLPVAVSRQGMPASPHRRMDVGAIGSMVADYPLQLDDVATPDEMRRTADWLWRNCRHEGGLFQEMIHSGVNAYLTLALAQTFLRYGDARFAGLVETTARLASPTGQWPEAVHPRTGGGCMGDGQHAWAAAEWLLTMRALFVREEPSHLVVGSGLLPSWLAGSGRLAYGPTNTAWGPVTVELHAAADDEWSATVAGRWWHGAPRIVMAVPGFLAAPVADRPDAWRLKRHASTDLMVTRT